MPTFRVDDDGDVEMSVPQPVYEFVSAPELTAWEQESLVNWRRERERYVEKIQQKCRTSNGPFDAAVMRVRDTVKPKVLKHLARYVLRKPVEDITDADIMAKVRERTTTLQNGHIPDVQAFFKANLRMDMSEKDIDARVLKYFVDFDQLVEDNGFESMLGIGSTADKIERLVLLQNKDARTDDVALHDLILQRATAQHHYHLMQLEEKPDKRVATAGNKKPNGTKAKPKPSGEPSTKLNEQKADAKQRLEEARAQIPIRPDSGADCCFLPEEYVKELQAVDTNVKTQKLDQPVPVELAGGKMEYCHYKCTVDLLLGTKAGPVHSLEIDVDGMMEQLAAGSVEQDDGDDLDNEPEVGRDETDSVAETLETLVQDAE
ncbi:hypothetical protein PHMEG_0008184, partial [Phytophthora megakarya]